MPGWTRRGAIAGAAATLAQAAHATGPGGGTGDIALLRRAYTELHPGLLRYSTAAEVAGRFDRLERAFGEAPDLRARYLLLSRFCATLRCGHTYANFFNQKKAVRQALFEGADRLPFEFLWLRDRMVVTRDAYGAGLAPGTEVLAVDGRPARDILAGLMTVARADGSNDGKRRRLVSLQGGESLESFDIYHSLLFGGRDAYRLRLRSPGGAVREETVRAVDLAARRAQAPPEPRDDAVVWTCERRGAAGVMTMPTWALYDSKWDWRGWLAARFEEMARDGVRGLVVDLRGNEGGQDCGDEIVARLIDAPLQLRDDLRLVRYRRTPDALKAALDTWDPSFRDWGDRAAPHDARFYELRDREDDGRAVGQVRPAVPRFRGRLVVLTSPQMSSATHQFAQAVRRHRLGLLVGEETGGNQRGINGGGFFFLRLPESGLEADLPLIGTFPRQPRPDGGVRPDVRIEPTVAAIASGRDPALSRALDLALA